MDTELRQNKETLRKPPGKTPRNIVVASRLNQFCLRRKKKETLWDQGTFESARYLLQFLEVSQTSRASGWDDLTFLHFYSFASPITSKFQSNAHWQVKSFKNGIL